MSHTDIQCPTAAIHRRSGQCERNPSRTTGPLVSWLVGWLPVSASIQTKAAEVPVVPCFTNASQTAGRLLAGQMASMQGRTAIFAYRNSLLYSIPMSTGNLDRPELNVRSRSPMDPANPLQLESLGVARSPSRAHRYSICDHGLIIDDGLWTFHATAGPGANLRRNLPGMDENTGPRCASNCGCPFHSWYVGPSVWDYSAVDGQPTRRAHVWSSPTSMPAAEAWGRWSFGPADHTSQVSLCMHGAEIGRTLSSVGNTTWASPRITRIEALAMQAGSGNNRVVERSFALIPPELDEVPIGRPERRATGAPYRSALSLDNHHRDAPLRFLLELQPKAQELGRLFCIGFKP